MKAADKKPSPMALLWTFADTHKPKFILSSLLAILGVLIGMAPYFCVALLLGHFYNKTATPQNICLLSGITILAYALKTFLTSASTIMSHSAAFHVLKNIRVLLSHKMERIPMGEMLGKASGTYKMLVIDQVDRIEKPLAHMIPEMSANLFTPVVILTILFVVDWRMGLGALATIPVGFIVTMGQMIGYKEKSARYQKANADMNDAIVEYVNGIEVIKAFNQSASSFGRFTNACKYYRDTTLEWWRGCWFFSAAGMTLLASNLLVTLPLGAYLFMNGSISFENFLMCAILSMGVSGPLLASMSYAESFATVFQAISHVGEFMDIQDQVRPSKNVELHGNAFEFKNVTFGYKEKNVLNGISFKTADPGITAIVGHSGSGKSTIAKLMAGFWDVGEGEILLGGVPLSKIPFKQQMEKISYVAQDNYLFNMTVRENIRLGRSSASDAEVEQAAKASVARSTQSGIIVLVFILSHCFVSRLCVEQHVGRQVHPLLLGHAGAVAIHIAIAAVVRCKCRHRHGKHHGSHSGHSGGASPAGAPRRILAGQPRGMALGFGTLPQLFKLLFVHRFHSFLILSFMRTSLTLTFFSVIPNAVPISS